MVEVMQMKVVMMVMVLEHGAPEEGELRKWKPPTLKSQLISKSRPLPSGSLGRTDAAAATHTHTHGCCC